MAIPTPRPPPARPASPAEQTHTPGHDDWLLDESLSETFPASDPIAPARPERPQRPPAD